MGAKITRWLQGAARALLCLACFALLLACFAGGMLRYSLFNRDFYPQSITDDAYCSAITAFIREDIEDDCYVYQLPFSVVEGQVSEQKVAAHCRAYITSLYDALCRGQDDTAADFPTQGFYDAVYPYLIGQGIDGAQAADDAQYLAEEMALRVNENVAVLSGQSIIAFLSDHLYSAGWLHALADWFWALLAGAAVLLAVQLLFGARRLSARLYMAGGTLFCAAAVVFVPIWLLRIYDLPSRLVLAHSPLKVLFRSFWSTLTDRMFFISLAGLLVAAVALAVAIVYIVWRKKPSEQ